MLIEVDIMLDWKREQSEEESKKYVCFKKTMYQTVMGERQDKKEGRRGEAMGMDGRDGLFLIKVPRWW